jgi:hypothetical protein
MTEVEFRQSVLRALWGEVRPELRSVSGSVSDEQIVLRFIVDGPISDALKDDLSSVGGEVVADTVSGFIEEEFLQLDAPADQTPHLLPLLIYQR